MIKYIVLLVAIIITTTSTYAKEGLHISSFMGASKSLDNQLAVHLEDQEDQVFKAKWNNRSFTDSHWWAARAESWKGNTFYGFELIHHKIYLKNTNDVIKSFSISDGYNLLYFNIGRQFGPHILRVGAGVIFAHPDMLIEGRERYITKGTKGHHLAGPTVQVSYERWVWENDTNFVSLDTKLTASYAVTRISDNDKEYAVAPDIALHVSLGLGSKPEALKQSFPKKLLYFIPFVYPRITGETLLRTGMFPEDGY
jgi:hypothetical protein